MFKTNLKPRRKVVDSKKAMRFAAIAFSLFLAIPPAQGQTNVVGGIAYGTNDLSAATSIASAQDGAGTLLIGFPSTTNLALNHDITGFIVITNQATNFSITATTNAVITSSGGPALTVINATNLNLTGGRYIGTAGTGGGGFPPIPGADDTAVGGLLRNSIATIDGSAFTGAAGNAGMVVQASELTVTDGTFTGGAGAAGLFAVSNSTVIINSGSFTGFVGMAVQDSDLTVIDGSFDGGAGGAGLLAISNSVVTITNGSFSGGDNAEGLFAENSDVTIEDGTFSGGTDAAALYARNSDLTVNGGTFQGGSFETNSYFGLVSIADAAETNNITLNGGIFNSIDFAGSGVQLLTSGTNLQVDGYVFLDGGTLIVSNASSSAFQNLWLRSGNIQFQNDYTLDSGGDLRFKIDGGTNSFLSADTVYIHTNSTLVVDALQPGFAKGTNDVELIIANNDLFVVGTTTNTATASDFTTNNVITSLPDIYALTGIFVDSGRILRLQFIDTPWREYWNATGQFGDLADELYDIDFPEMRNLIEGINDSSISGAAVEQTYFTTFNSYQTALQGMRAAVGQSVARGTQLRDQKRMVPYGARGPRRRRGQPPNQLRGWGKYYGNYYTHSKSGLYPSYESGQHGGVVGIDTSVGKLILGISGGASRYETVFNNDARENTTAAHGNLYGTYGGERGYIDAGIAYGQNRVETRTADPFRLDGDFDAELANVYLGGGYDLIDSEGGTVFTPEVSIQYARYKQDAYSETGTAAVPRVFDEFDAHSLLGSIGMNIAMQQRKALQTFAFQLDGRLHWMHEFNADPSNIRFKLAGGSNPYQMNYPGLDEEIYRIGIGCSFFNTGRRKPKNVVFRIDFDELFGDGFNSHNLSAKVIYAF